MNITDRGGATLVKLTAVLALSIAAAGSAMAQDAGPDGMGPGAPRLQRHRAHDRHQAYGYRPLTVVRRPVAPVVVAPAPLAGPDVIIGAPVRAARAIVGVPFRIAGSLFPAEGSLAANPLVIIGAPIQAAGRIAQVPFDIIEAPFGAPGPALF